MYVKNETRYDIVLSVAYMPQWAITLRQCDLSKSMGYSSEASLTANVDATRKEEGFACQL